MLFYIVTPACNARQWLPSCVRSVADQVGNGVQVHHHVQDGGSRDGSVEWLQAWQASHDGMEGYRLTFSSEPDAGMYDALNRAWNALPYEAEVTAQLNADEQYLPDALAAVAAEFAEEAEPELVLGSYFVLDPEGRYLCHRRAVQPRLWSSVTLCEIITCSCFYRAEAFRRWRLHFNATWKCLADLFFFRRLLSFDPRISSCPKLLTSTFTCTGSNLAWSERNHEEVLRYYATLPHWVVALHPYVRRWVNFKRWWLDLLLPTPREYSIYLPRAVERSHMVVSYPTSHWGDRSMPR